MNRHRFASPFLALAAVLAGSLVVASAQEIKAVPEPEVYNSIGLKLRRIPAGSATVRVTDEDFIIRPVADSHEIKIEKPFYLGTYEVTQAEYEKVMGTNPSSFSPAGDNRHRIKDLDTKRFPVENITLARAQEFCEKLSALPEEKKMGRVYRLPTGDEWEYCARAGSSENVLFGFGPSLTGEMANFNGEVPHGASLPGPNLKRPAAVGSYKANAWGLHDMHGNVWEWTSDVFRRKDGTEVKGFRMLRSGSWLNRGRDCAASTRLGLEPDEIFNNVGFRVVCEVKK